MYISNKQIKGAKVYDSDGHLIAFLERALIDPDNGQVLALQAQLHGDNLISPHDILSWKTSHLTLGQQYQFHNREDLVRVDRLLQDKHPDLLGKAVRTETNNFIGYVSAYSINTEHALLASITTQRRFLFHKWGTRLIHYNQIIEIKPTEIIVRDNLIKIPLKQSTPDKFALQKSPTFDQA